MRPTALIIDDSLTVRMDLAEAFEAARFEPLLCDCAAAARDAVRARHVDVIVLDQLLPDAHGTELLEELRRREGLTDVPVIMLSSEGEVRDRIRSFSTGADEYIGKPYDAAYLIARAQELIRLRRRASASDAPTVLVIEDSITFRRALRETLEAAGYAVLEAASGEEGLRLAGSSRPAAVIVDDGLPGMDGATVVRQLRRDAALRDVPCLLLTGSDARQTELRAFEAGVDAFARKDGDAALALARLAALLRQSAAALPVHDERRTLHGMRRLLLVGTWAAGPGRLDHALRADGYDVVSVGTAADALAVLPVQPVDCILLQASGSDDDARQSCRQLKSAPVSRDIPVLVLGAGDERRLTMEALEAGADDYIATTSDVRVLLARVAARIRRKQGDDDTRRVREEFLKRELEAAEARSARQVAEVRAALVEELEQKNRELEAFSYSVSHDLRAPLRAIGGFSRIVLTDLSDGLDVRGREYLQRVCLEADRMGERIDALLELARLGRTAVNRQRVDLSAMAGDVLDGYRRESPRAVDTVVAPGIEAEADPRMMRAVLENLLGNAWKFTGRTDDARIEFGVHEGPPPIYVVRDNGPGFDMRLVDRLFRPFQRLHRQQDVPGTGVGLATVQRIVERHGGRVWAESVPGGGTTFSFTLAPERSRDPQESDRQVRGDE